MWLYINCLQSQLLSNWQDVGIADGIYLIAAMLHPVSLNCNWNQRMAVGVCSIFLFLWYNFLFFYRREWGRRDPVSTFSWTTKNIANAWGPVELNWYLMVFGLSKYYESNLCKWHCQFGSGRLTVSNKCSSKQRCLDSMSMRDTKTGLWVGNSIECRSKLVAGRLSIWMARFGT